MAILKPSTVYKSDVFWRFCSDSRKKVVSNVVPKITNFFFKNHYKTIKNRSSDLYTLDSFKFPEFAVFKTPEFFESEHSFTSKSPGKFSGPSLAPSSKKLPLATRKDVPSYLKGTAKISLHICTRLFRGWVGDGESQECQKRISFLILWHATKNLQLNVKKLLSFIVSEYNNFCYYIVWNRV